MNIKQLIDDLFTALEAAEPSLAPILAMLNGIIDEIGIPALTSLLAGLGITSTVTPQVLLDGLFTALDAKFAGHTLMLFLLAGIQDALDAAVTKLTVTPKGFKSL